MMDIVVTYDVNTQTKEGRRRLRLVAKTCEGFGQRVQYSVFECRLTDTQLVRLRLKLSDEIDPGKDSLRIYHLTRDHPRAVETFGRDHWIDLSGPLVM